MEAFGPIMLLLLQEEEDEKRKVKRPKRKKERRVAPPPKPKPKAPPASAPKQHILGARRPRIFRERTGLEGLTDEEVVERYHLPKGAILDLYELIRVDIDPLTQRSHAIPGMVKLLNCLHFFTSGSFQTKASAVGGVSQSTFSRFLVPVIQALKKHVHVFIGFPTNHADWQALKRGFFQVAGLPHVIGAIDCTHVALSAPHEREEIYRNKKGYHSVNVQVIADSNCRILSLFSAFPGSSDESFILRQSSVYEGFEGGRIGGGWLVGSTSYESRPWLLTPVLDPSTDSEKAYNEAHSRTRSVIDKTFKLLKTQFKCLNKSGGGLQYDPTKVSDIIVACCILHNIAVQHNIPTRAEVQKNERALEMPKTEPELQGSSQAVRSRVIRDYFS
ncbi:putative nuclease HARBI1 [Spea bombifrons]|uniref:putative nuclease HARBI1 n=1 Tax=Spea bombifrons TaxID=233779 RepID=UPI002349F763|nr:putative nuclease HARBI1 [Spea bombifrons]